MGKKIYMDKVEVVRGEEKIEVLSPVFGTEEIETLRSMFRGPVRISNPVPTEELWDGKTLFLARQNGRERRFV